MLFKPTKLESIIICDSLIFTLATTSVIEVYAAQACSEATKRDVQEQVDRYKILSPIQSINEQESDLDKTITDSNNYLKSFQQLNELIKQQVKPLSKNETSAVNFIKDIDSEKSESGIIKNIIKIKSDDGTFSSSTDEYKYSYDKINNKLITEKLSYFKTSNSLSTPEQIPENIQKKIIERKANLPQRAKGEKVEFKNKNRDEKPDIQALKNSIAEAKCSGIKTAAANTTYQRYWASDYARNRANMPGWNTNYNYLGQWAWDSNTNQWNFSGNDCTNFASQAMLAGGIKRDTGSWNPFGGENWYANMDSNGRQITNQTSRTFLNVQAFMDHFYNYENTENWLDYGTQYNPNYGIFDPLLEGDLMFIDYENNGQWGHTMTITGWDKVWLPPNYNYYRWEPRLSYHSSDTSNISFANFRLKLYSTPNNPINPNARMKGLQIYNSW